MRVGGQSVRPRGGTGSPLRDSHALLPPWHERRRPGHGLHCPLLLQDRQGRQPAAGGVRGAAQALHGAPRCQLSQRRPPPGCSVAVNGTSCSGLAVRPLSLPGAPVFSGGSTPLLAHRYDQEEAYDFLKKHGLAVRAFGESSEGFRIQRFQRGWQAGRGSGLGRAGRDDAACQYEPPLPPPAHLAEHVGAFSLSGRLRCLLPKLLQHAVCNIYLLYECARIM